MSEALETKEQITKTFDADVPLEVFLEVRRNMKRNGWVYKETMDAEQPNGDPIKVQHYERSILQAPTESGETTAASSYQGEPDPAVQPEPHEKPR